MRTDYDRVDHRFIIADKLEINPIRSETFSAERLVEHAKSLAEAQNVTNDPKKGYDLYKRLKSNQKTLFNSYRVIDEAVNQKQAINSADEWLIDNFHIIEEQLKDIQEHLPIWFYKELPKLAKGPLEGYPRVYGLSWAFVAHADSRFDPELLIQFVRAYQTVQVLSIGELWAIAITLRVVLIENLRGLSTNIIDSLQSRKIADKIADDYLGLDVQKSKAAEIFLYSFEHKVLRESFLVQLIQRFRYQDPSVTPALQWVNDKLASMDLSIDEIVSREHSQQSATNLTVRNIITSMRLISAFNWRDFFESISLVNETFKDNPIFKTIDSTTQDQYLHTIEELAKGSKHTEIDIAQKVISRIDKYQTENTKKPDERKLDPGHYLINSGRKILEKEINFRPSLKRRLKDFYITNAKLGYASSILILTALILSYPLLKGYEAGLPWWMLTPFFLTACLLASDIAIPLLHKSIIMIVGPQQLPRIKLESVSEDLSTFVVMPILLINKEVIEEHLQQLEVHYLSNPDENLYFALLSDWQDSKSSKDLNDAELLDIATEGIAKLNSSYGLMGNGEKHFYIFQRERIWNASEDKWMGWERKRGKLHEFNRLLRGVLDTSYISTNDQVLRTPPHIKYVVTLDADTLMPMGTVKKLIGTMAHPLNKARYDEASKRVIEGYGILQPRVVASLPSRTNSSVFQKLFSGLCGLDPYSFSTSDIYQDLFGEGTFVGKGIYDLDAFEASIRDKIPENTMLSHDLFEGTFARCGFVSDLNLFEDYPSHVEVAVSRVDRWCRGDWQLLPWILGTRSSSMPLIGRWKMLDNLRRSLSFPAMIAMLLLAWFLPEAPHLCWTIFVITALCFPVFLPFLSSLLVYPASRNFNQARINLIHEFKTAFQQSLCLISLLLYYGLNASTAILRTLYRLFISKHNLLEWLSAAQQKVKAQLSKRYFWNKHKQSVIIAGLLAVLLLLLKLDNEVKILAAPFITLWLFSPLIARLISLHPKANAKQILDLEETNTLRLIARRTWKFFTSFVTESDNSLPPDNFQETPEPVIAHRSSPTNFGLYLLSIVAAKDFAWIGLGTMIDKLEATVKALQELPRYNGHFYNWYDLQTKEALNPQYISSVDSGNFAGYLLVTAQACEESLQTNLLTLSTTEGVRDSLSLMKESLLETRAQRKTLTVNVEQLQDAIKQLDALLDIVVETPFECTSLWQSMHSKALILVDIAEAFTQEQSANAAALFWAQETCFNIESKLKDLESLLSWTQFLNQANTVDLSDSTKKQLELLNSPRILELSLSDLCIYYKTTLSILRNPVQEQASGYLLDLISELAQSYDACRSLSQRTVELSQAVNKLFNEMDFSFLFDPLRKLFSIGFNVSDASLDVSYYDMLASEARLTSFIAISKAEAPVEHWFSMSRTLTPLHNDAALLSWSGSMFEYLMPSLIMYTPRESLLDRTCHLIIEKQIKYGLEQGVPWGVSESAYNVRDLHLTYQYSSFGIPGLGLKRGIAQDLVISPYSTALAAMYYPRSALENFKKLREMSALGSYGFYEAIDFTAARIPEGEDSAIVQSYMAHHQGMSLVAIANVVFQGIMRHRFHRIPRIKATELMLQERTPLAIAVERPRIREVEKTNIKDLILPDLRHFGLPKYSIPVTHFLSNGHYTVMLSSAGSGYSSCNGMAVTRWREDLTCDMYGSHIFLFDTATKKSWSVGYQPSAVKPDDYQVTFTEDKARIAREDNGIITTLDVVVSTEDNAEIRRVSIKNTNHFAVEIELTSYNEIVLAPLAADAAHPAFSNLFVETEYLDKTSSIIASRRVRSVEEEPVWMAHTLAVEGDAQAGVEYETDRSRFLGRGCSIREALSIVEGQPLSNTVGAVLDPIASLRTRISIPPGGCRSVLFSTIVGNSREEIIDLTDRYHDPTIFERASSLAWTYGQAQLHHLAIDDMDANLFQQLASSLVYSNAVARPGNTVLQRNSLNVTGLWAHQISGDYPILLVQIDSIDEATLLKQLLRAHEYWQLKQFTFDLVILNGKANSYVQDLQVMLETMVRTSLQQNIFVLRADLLTQEEKELIETAARVVMSCKDGSLAEQVMRFKQVGENLVYRKNNPYNISRQSNASLTVPELEFFNGLGGFADDGREYVIVLGKQQYTPAPWVNIISNNQLGFLVSESGSSYTWSLNSKENQISPWSNDPVVDPSGEVFYISDLDTQEFWTPTALPIRIDDSSYITRHGQGYSSFEHLSHDIESKLTQYVSYDDPVKISRLRLKNHSNKTRRIAVTAYVELVLGASRAVNAPYVVTEHDEETGAMFASNPWNKDFGQRITFADFAGKQSSETADRTEFIGRNGSLKYPSALVHGTTLSPSGLSGKIGAGHDPCFAQNLFVEIPANASVDLSFFLGQCEDKETARKLVDKYRNLDLDLVLDNVKAQWDTTLGKLQVQTPDREVDFLLNRWSLYQVLACRYWARTAFYQAGGAYGFRDQLQDVMALTVSHPEITREQILNAAAHQFLEGDVQHWWHPPTSKGVRTHCSDDSLWLPFVVHHYIKTTGDYQILDEQVPFLEGSELPAEEESFYSEPTISDQSASLFEHCKRVLDRSLKVGSHGLPLIGSCDWNDGMNMVGHKGLGESVWLGWFLYTTLTRFAGLVEDSCESESLTKWTMHAESLKQSLEREAWDGAWYKRAYFDDGRPLGSASNAECRIDCIAQSWSVISQAADKDRSIKAMESVEKYLVRTGDNISLLFTPPFDKTDLNPGYIKGYLPGIRENGSQYTHAATWNIFAFAMLGNAEKAYELFSMLNPINHTNTRSGVYKYKVEPYVIAADVYSEPPHIGRGGWTWYTGSAAWMYRAGMESILGLTFSENTLWVNPCIPDRWQGFKASYQHGVSTIYKISVTNRRSGMAKIIELDGQIISVAEGIPLIDDGKEHLVQVTL